MVKDMVARFVNEEIKPIAAKLDNTHRHPEEICRKLGKMGLMGVAVSVEYCGAGMDNVTYVMALIEISRGCASCGVITSVNNSLYGYPVTLLIPLGPMIRRRDSWRLWRGERWRGVTH